MSRKMARETVMHVYYQMEIHGEYRAEIAKVYVEEVVDNEEDNIYINNMISLFIENREIIDEHINQNLKGWDIERISKIDLSILRIGLAEMLFREDIPMKVSINEAIELGKTYGTEESPSFISGLLGAVAKTEELDV